MDIAEIKKFAEQAKPRIGQEPVTIGDLVAWQREAILAMEALADECKQLRARVAELEGVGPIDKYLPRSPQMQLAYLAEEAGELVASVGKSLRWGLDSYNPELAVLERETNAAWIRREIANVRAACCLVETMLDERKEVE
ncbi:MAG: hypothetical protein ACE5NA_13400 [Nitrospiraceae bacterium]